MTAHGHPRVANSRNNYVLEHILIMEKRLGRYLFKDERVHHKNGVKGDNALENLELWVLSPPQDPESPESLDWAMEMIRRYDS